MTYAEIVHIASAPGLPDGVRLQGLGPGLNVIWGPNAMGKSTCGRTLLASLFGSDLPLTLVASVHWRHADVLRTAEIAGSQRRWVGEPPASPAASLGPLYTLTLKGLLDATDTDAAFGRRVAVELAGGFDLRAAEDAFPTRTRPGKARREVDDAREALLREQGRTDGLVENEAALVGIREALEAARAADRLASDLRDSVTHATAVRDLRGVQGELLAFPATLEQLDGGEVREIERHLEAEQEAAERRADAAKDVARITAELERSTARGPLPAEQSLRAWRSQAGEAGRLKQASDTARRDAAATTAAREEATEGLLRTPGDTLGAERLVELHRAVTLRAEAAAERRAAAAVAQMWAGRTGPSSNRPLEPVVEVLQRWLRTPDVRPMTAAWVWLAAALAIGLGAVVLHGQRLPGSALVVAGCAFLLLGVGLALLVERILERQRDPRPALAQEAEALGAAVEAWEPREVSAALRGLGQLLARGRLEALAAREREDAERQLAAAQARERATARDVADQVASIGLSTALLDLPLADQLRRIELWHRARVDAAGARGRAEEARRLADAAWAGLRDDMVAHAGDAPSDVEGVAAWIEVLSDRQQRHREWARDLEDARVALHEAGEAGASAREGLEALEARLGSDPRDLEAVRALLLQHRRQAELRGQEDMLQRQIGRLAEVLDGASALRGAVGSDPQSWDTATAEGHQACFRELAERMGELAEDQARLEQVLEAARGGTSLADASARFRAARDELRAQKHREVHSLLGAMLLAQARERVESEHAPRVLERARDLFTRFTCGQWGLEVHDEELRAVQHATGECKDLDVLSDATRVQLLLAARVAVIEEEERGGAKLPLVLDEVMNTTSPRRFQAMAASVLELVASGRQVLYLTPNENTAAAWMEAARGVEGVDARRIDLALAAPVLFAAPPETTQVPRPDGMTALAYAQLIGVTQPRRELAAPSWHLWYLLHDDLDTLHGALELGFRTVGEWEAAAGRLGVTFNAEVQARLARRARWLHATVDAVGIGRGRPVTWDVVEGSGQVTPTFHDRWTEALAATEGDAAAFLEALWAIPRRREKNIRALEELLEEQGFLDGREILGRPDVVRHVAMRDAEGDHAELPAFVGRLAAWLMDGEGDAEVA